MTVAFSVVDYLTPSLFIDGNEAGQNGNGDNGNEISRDDIVVTVRSAQV